LTLRDYADVIAPQVSRVGPRVIVAHSFSGVLLPLLADSADILVFEAALIPEPGKSVREQFTEDPSMLLPDWVAAGSRWFDPAQHEAIAREFLFHDCDEATIRWALTTLETFNTRNLITEPSPIAEWPAVRCEYLLCTGDRTINPEWSRATARLRFGHDAIAVPGGHAPHVSRPELVAEILDGLAKTAAT
jgi:pimeloyl-ACP methyl ester carboxylesterase